MFKVLAQLDLELKINRGLRPLAFTKATDSIQKVGRLLYYTVIKLTAMSYGYKISDKGAVYFITCTVVNLIG